MRRCPPGWSVLYFSFYIDFMHSLHRLSRGRWSVHGVSYAGHDSQRLIKRSMPCFRSVGRQFHFTSTSTFASTFTFTLHPGSFCPNPCRPLGRLGMSDALRVESVRPQWPARGRRSGRTFTLEEQVLHKVSVMESWARRWPSGRSAFCLVVCRMTYLCVCAPVRSCTPLARARWRRWFGPLRCARGLVSSATHARD